MVVDRSSIGCGTHPHQRFGVLIAPQRLQLDSEISCGHAVQERGGAERDAVEVSCFASKNQDAFHLAKKVAVVCERREELESEREDEERRISARQSRHLFLEETPEARFV